MPSPFVQLSDELVAKAKAQAQERGFGSPEEYIGALIDADAAPLDPDIERLLIDRIEDPRPSIDATPEFWQGLREQVARGKPQDGSSR